MPLDQSLIHSVGFIWSDRRSRPIGTFFLVTVPSPDRPDRVYGYAVTAAHVVISENETELRLITADGDAVSYSPPSWETPLPEIDIAVTAYPGDELPHNITASSLETLSASVLDWTPRLGATVYYIGLLRGIVDEMEKASTPMVRTGTVGALYQDGVQIEAQPAQQAHLVDVRSRAGFSGAPVWIEQSFTGPRVSEIPHQMVGAPDVSIADAYGQLHYAQALWGVMAGYVEEGVAAVLPVEAIHRVIEHEEISATRK